MLRIWRLSRETLNFIASLLPGQIHGFDSFEGLPEDWRQGHEKGTFAVGHLPRVRPNVRLYKGWFEDTLPAFREQYPGPVAFLHLDADLYSSTKTVLDILGEGIVPGTVIAFDEFFNYPGWRKGNIGPFVSSVANAKWKCGISDSCGGMSKRRRRSPASVRF